MDASVLASRTRLVGVAGGVALLFASWTVGVGAPLPEALRNACVEEIPRELRTADVSTAASGETDAGSWSIDAEDLDGSGTAEAILTVLPTGRPGEVVFFGERDGGKIELKKVRLKGGHLVRASVAFPRFADGAFFAHVNGREAGQVLLYWNGDDLERVWEVGKVRENEARWFELEDLNEDGTSEVITYYRRELDVFTDEDELSGTGGSDANLTSGKIDVESVLRFDDGKWKKDRGMLESLR